MIKVILWSSNTHDGKGMPLVVSGKSCHYLLSFTFLDSFNNMHNINVCKLISNCLWLHLNKFWYINAVLVFPGFLYCPFSFFNHFFPSPVLLKKSSFSVIKAQLNRIYCQKTNQPLKFAFSILHKGLIIKAFCIKACNCNSRSLFLLFVFCWGIDRYHTLIRLKMNQLLYWNNNILMVSKVRCWSSECWDTCIQYSRI